MISKISKIGIVCITIVSFSVTEMNAQKSQKVKPQQRPTFEQLLEKMDKNEDGKLSKKEVKGPLNDHFDEIDKDEDGFITSKEFANAPKPERNKGKM